MFFFFAHHFKHYIIFGKEIKLINDTIRSQDTGRLKKLPQNMNLS